MDLYFVCTLDILDDYLISTARDTLASWSIPVTLSAAVVLPISDRFLPVIDSSSTRLLSLLVPWTWPPLKRPWFLCFLAPRRASSFRPQALRCGRIWSPLAASRSRTWRAWCSHDSALRRHFRMTRSLLCYSRWEKWRGRRDRPLLRRRHLGLNVTCWTKLRLKNIQLIGVRVDVEKLFRWAARQLPIFAHLTLANVLTIDIWIMVAVSAFFDHDVLLSFLFCLVFSVGAGLAYFQRLWLWADFFD